ncbi:hypothetical protein BPO_1772 [Bergeyella porcorum]|uniref:Uncharacterized protein n=1 Tax=Bergeyella porcorum TaxID=1735111 RepID=A0AAU0F500_9FLAO
MFFLWKNYRYFRLGILLIFRFLTNNEEFKALRECYCYFTGKKNDFSIDNKNFQNIFVNNT